MKQFVEFVPVALFAGVFFYTRDIYIATAILMLGVCVQVGYEYGSTKRVEKKTQVIFWVAILFGGATLLFRNEAFLLWKPTVVNWLFSAALLVSHFMSRENLIEKMLSEQLALPKHAWRNLNFGWSLGFFVAGALNLIVAYTFSLEFWVSYKLFGGIAITMVYMIVTVVYLVKGGYLTDEALENNAK
ncbi:MAG: inner membrane-spanning protein YciB [Pseudomonadota bacterium]